MRDTLKIAADKLRLQAILLSTLCLLAACALPVASYVYVFRYSHQELGPFAWSLWAVAGATAALAILAHSVGSRALLAVHAAFGGMLGAALGGFYTAFWYTLDTRCAVSQASFQGCLGCACAGTNTCTATLLADPQCASCTAYPTDVCGPVQLAQNKFVLAFSGLSAVVFLALPAAYSLLVLGRLEASAAAGAAKRQMLAFAVDQQTALVEAGDKPTVTPGQLAGWVGRLLDFGEPDCAAIGDKCRAALAARGFELPLPTRPKKRAQPARRGRWGKQGGKGGAQEVSLTASSLPPAAEALAAAEAGQGSRPGGTRRDGQVSAEGRGQFLAQR